MKSVLLLISCLMFYGCSKVSYVPQYSAYILVTTPGDAESLNKELLSQADIIGFNNISLSGNTEHFAKSNQFQQTLRKSEGKSFIMIGNVLEARCVRLSVFSEKDELEARIIMNSIMNSIAENPKVVNVSEEGGKCAL